MNSLETILEIEAVIIINELERKFQKEISEIWIPETNAKSCLFLRFKDQSDFGKDETALEMEMFESSRSICNILAKLIWLHCFENYKKMII